MPIEKKNSLQAHIAAYRSQLDALIRRGRELHGLLIKDPASSSAVAATRIWQEQCGVLINQLSGGSKAHWLARSFSEAFLMRTDSGQAVEGVAPEKIVERVLDVLDQAVASLSQKDNAPVLSAAPEPAPRRFDFVHNPDLRRVVDQAYTESRQALEQREYDVALRTFCGILEAIVTDALEYKGLNALAAFGAPKGKIADWSFESRLSVAEKAGLIRGGCARLPDVARMYRHFDEGASTVGVSERDARRTAQVLQVIMRDLNPGR
jgi:hypothetical protein